MTNHTAPKTTFKMHEVQTEPPFQPEHFAKLALDYIENQWELTRLKLAEKLAIGASTLIGGAITAFFTFFFVVFSSFGTALWIGDALGSRATGFFMVALVYLVLLFLALIFIKPVVQKNIIKTIINALDNENENDD